MRLPVLESIIDGGDYNLSFPTGVLFGDYYNKSLKNDFDIKNNPFNFISNWREIKLLNLRNDDEDDDSFRKVFGAYDIIQCYSLEGARSDIDALLNNLALELDYLSKQLNLFERDYDSPEFFKGLIIEVFEYLLEKQRELYDEYIKQILLDYIFAFYFEYRKELDIWKEESNRNKRLLKILFDGGNWYNSIYEILDCIKNLDIKKSSHSYMVKRELSYIVDSIQRLQTTNFYISHLLYTNCVFELKILCFNLSNEFVRVIFLGKDYDALTSDRLELSNYLYKIPKENRREVIQKMYDIWSTWFQKK